MFTRVIKHKPKKLPQKLSLIIFSGVLFSASLFWCSSLSFAATYTEVWTSRGDFEDNETTTGNPTTRNKVDTATSPDNVRLDIWPEENYAEDFTTQDYMDAGNTTADWDTELGELRLPEGIVTDLEAKIIGIWGTDNTVLSSLYINGRVYIGTNVGHFGYYDCSTAEAVDLTSNIDSIWGGAWINDMVFDLNDGIYLVGPGRFVKYNILSQEVDDLADKVAFMGNYHIQAITYDEARGDMYLGNSNGNFAKYNLTTELAEDLTDKIGYFWGENDIQELEYDSLNNNIYLVGDSGTFAQYDPSTDTVVNLKGQIVQLWNTNDTIECHLYFEGKVYVGTSKGRFGYYDTDDGISFIDLTDKIYSFWGVRYIYAITVDVNNGEIYIGGGYGRFAKYNTSTGLAANLTNLISPYWGSSRHVRDLAFDSIGNDIYVAGNYCEFVKYNTQSEIVTDLTPEIEDFWGSSNMIRALTFDSFDQKIYLGGNNKNFAQYDPVAGSATDLSGIIAEFMYSGLSHVYELTFDPGNQEVYLGGYKGEFIKYIPLTNSAEGLTDRISSFWGSTNIRALEFSPYDNNIYLGARGYNFARYDIAGDIAYNLRDRISSFWGNSPLYDFTFDTVYNDLYLAGSSGKFARYNRAEDQAYDLSNYPVDIMDGVFHINGLVFDVATNEIYFGCNGGKFARYFISTGIIDDLTNSIPSWGTTTMEELIYDETGQDIYVGGINGKFGVYDPEGQNTQNLSDTISSFWGSWDIRALAFSPDAESYGIYLGGERGNFAKYDPELESATDLFADIAAFFDGYIDINAIAYDSIRQDIYLGGNSGKFGRYNISDGTATDLTDKISSFWSVNYIYSLLFDPLGGTNGCIYLGGRSRFARYDPSQEEAYNLSGLLPSSWNNKYIRALCLDSENNEIYLGLTSGKFGKYDPSVPPDGEIIDLTDRIEGFWGTAYVYALAFDPINIDVYLAGGGGEFAKYTPGNEQIEDLSGTIEDFWLGESIYSLCLESINEELYIGGDEYSPDGYTAEARFAKRATPDGPAVDLKDKINDFFGYVGAYGWWASEVRSMTFSLDNGVIFLGGTRGKLAKYVLSAEIAYDLSALIESFWGTKHILTLVYSADGKTFIGGEDSKFALLDTPSTAQAQSININPTGELVGWATLNKSDTPGTGTIAYYLSNNGGQDFEEVTPGELHTFTTSGSDLRWKVVLSGDATVQSISIAYNGYYSVGTIEDLQIDAGAIAGWATISWNSTLNGQTVKFRTRSAATMGGLGSADWSDYYTGSGSEIASVDNQWLEIEMTLETTDGAETPWLHDFSVVYAINSAPEVANVTAYEDANGVVQIEYDVRDEDTDQGAIPWEVDITFQYFDGSDWQEAITTTGEERVSVDTVNWSHYTGTWNAKADFDGQFLENAQIRVIANDGEALYNIGTGDSPAFVLDTKNPTSPFIEIDSGVAKTNSVDVTLSLSVIDDTMTGMQMMISNDPGFAGAEYEAYATSKSWTLPEGDGDKTVYVKFRDAYGNVSDVANDSIELDQTPPDTPGSVYIDDVSNPETEEWRLFITWGVVADPGDFQQYNIWRSTEGGFPGAEPYAVITDISTNYFLDEGLNNTETYYYKLTSQDDIENISEFSETVAAQPDGAGGADEIPPEISNVSVESVGDTTATITWDTDELSDSTVGYSEDLSFINEQGNPSMVLEHTVTLTGLEPGTTYYFRVMSIDGSSNEGVDDNGGAGYTFTTTSDVTPPFISNVASGSITNNSANITWDTDEAAMSQVEYGLTTDYGSLTTLDSDLETSHSVILSGLDAGTTYHYRVRSKDASENEAISSDYMFTTLAGEGDVTAPVISNVSASDVTSDSATISWTTDELSNSTVGYSEDQTFLTEGGSSTLVTAHSVTLTGLESSTLYYFRVKSEDEDNNEAADDNTGSGYTFTTLAAEESEEEGEEESEEAEEGSEEESEEEAEENVSLGISGDSGSSSVSGGGGASSPELLSVETSSFDQEEQPAYPLILTTGPIVIDILTNTVTITWVTDRPANSIVLYKSFEASEDSAFLERGDYANLVTNHSVKLSALQPGTSYEYQVKSIDAGGSEGTSTMDRFKTLPLPEISSIIVSDISLNSAAISWSTSTPAISIVEYGLNERYGKTIRDRKKVLDHKTKLTNLKDGTLYYFRIKGVDNRGKLMVSDGDTFQTPPKPVIVNFKIKQLSFNKAEVSWKTNVETDSKIKYTPYRNSILNRAESKTQGKPELTKAHIIELTDLKVDVIYEIRIQGRDKHGNKVLKSIPDFTIVRDKTPPFISGVRTEVAMASEKADVIQGLISWQTDEPSSSKVLYQEGSEGKSDNWKETPLDDNLTTKHLVVVDAFKPGTVYRIKAISADGFGNESESKIFSVLTQKKKEGIIQIIINNFEQAFGWLKKIKINPR